MLSLFLILSLFQLGIESESKISLESCCTCRGFTLSYECRVKGNRFGTTVWYGSAFDCVGGEISLLHSLYADDTVSHVRPYGECNKGSIVAQGLGIENNTYFVSQLNVTISADVIGKSIECSYDSAFNLELIGVKTISISEYVQPPNVSEVVDLATREITFNWTKVAPDCPAVCYNILTSNCGSCPTSTIHTNATCTDLPTDGSVCAFVVQTLICGNILGRFSDTLYIVELKDKSNNDSSNPNIYSCNNIQRSVFTGAIVSATLLGGIISMCVTILITVIIQQKREAKTCVTEQELPDRLYDDVIHNQSSQTESAIIDVGKNVAYGRVASAS